MRLKWVVGAAIMMGGLAMGQAGAASTTLSDFESRFAINNLGGYWYFFSDKTDSGLSVVTTQDTASPGWDTTAFVAGAEGTATAAKLGFIFGAKDPVCGKNCTYPPMVGMGTTFLGFGTADLTGATAISFWAKADAPLKVDFNLATAAIKDNGTYAKAISVTTSWKKFTVSLQPGTDLKQPTWAKQIPFAPDSCTTAGWNISKGNNTTVTQGAFYLDNIVIENWALPAVSIHGIANARHQAYRAGASARAFALPGAAGSALVNANGRQLPAAAQR